jgi:hypothetical protein
LGSHTYNLSFNFPPQRLEADEAAPGTHIYNGERVKVRIVPLLHEGLTSRVLKGSTAPKGGWVSYGYAVKTPAPQLIYTQVGATPARFLTAIVQDGRGEVRRESAEGGSGIALAVRSGGRSWRVKFRHEAAQWAFAWERAND